MALKTGVKYMENTNEIEYWRNKASEYDILYHEQKKLTEAYRKIMTNLIHDLIEDQILSAEHYQEKIRNIGEK